MPRVLFVHHRPQPSGAARSLALLVAALPDAWDAHVLAPGGGAARLFEEAGATVHRAPVPAFAHTWDVQYRGLRWLVALREAAWLPGHARALRRVLRATAPDVVHVNDGVMLASGVLASRAGFPVVWHLRSSLAHGGRDARSRRISRLIDRHGDAAVAIDRDVASTYALRLPLEVIANPVRVDPGEPADLGVPAGRLAVGYFGYLRRQKGWPQLLEALRLLADRDVPVQGVFVGGGVRPSSAFRGPRGRLLRALGVPDEEADLERSIRERGLADRVTRVPFTDDVGAVLRALDVVVFPNQGAGLGRPVLEAAAYGLPVVASGSPDGGGVLDPGVTGILLPAGTPTALADALAELAADGELRSRLGAAARARVATPEEAAERVVRVWESVR
jgi:glycosyltransferase involved in cell wall biosynthesis